MKLRARLGCKNCNSFEEKIIHLPFDCDNFECVNCGESNCLFVVSILSEIESDNNKFPNINLLDNLCKIRKLC